MCATCGCGDVEHEHEHVHEHVYEHEHVCETTELEVIRCRSPLAVVELSCSCSPRSSAV
ncbi:MAG TPA: hypothetical protein VIQ54_06060 [Polyangia bacterium]